jgi:hypothetical protein
MREGDVIPKTRHLAPMRQRTADLRSHTMLLFESDLKQFGHDNADLTSSGIIASRFDA